MTSFERARRPEQKAERRAALLDAAADLLAAHPDPHALSLNDLAARAGMAKSNVYRYFDSREAVLLALLSDRFTAWSEATSAALRALEGRAGDTFADRVEAVGGVLARETAGRPIVCLLLSVLPDVLERHASVEAIVDAKATLFHGRSAVARAMALALPDLPLEAHEELLFHAVALILGGWPLAHPGERAREAVHRLTGGPFPHDFERDLRRAFALMAHGWRAAPRPA